MATTLETENANKKAKKESPSEIIEGYQLEMIENLKKERRDNATTETDVGDDVDDDRFNILFLTVRALIDTNSEIWERCLPYMKEGPNGMLRFYRLGYPTIKAGKYRSSKNMELSTQLKAEGKDFAAFPCFPRILSNIVPFEKQTDRSLLNYDDCLIKISCLVKSVAYHSFSIFKDHLEDIQVSLGKIETWITESEDAANFINNKLGMNLVIPELGDVATAGVVYPSSICVKCFHRKDEHLRNRDDETDRFYCRNQGNRVTAGSFIDSNVTRKTVRATASVSVDASFNVSSEVDQKRFKYFMKYVESW
mmetsp:Transcript_13754/g.33160  ORF Transcript_13754/g.33160 Transcript_13754/m.33160 type:complete len:308 (-) Transcript_13754:220-1143(-)